MSTRRFLIAVDVDEASLDEGDCTIDDVAAGFSARLGEFYPRDDGAETLAQLVACAEVTESLGFLLAAAGVGLEGYDDEDVWSARVQDEGWVALTRFGQDLEAYVPRLEA